MVFLLIVLQSIALALPTVDEIIKQIDTNMNYDTRTAKIQMTVTKGRRVKKYELISHGRGKQEAAAEFFKPPREKGRKMLKKNSSLWIYLPNAEKTQKISGHMLRQGMMGSDMSYEDMLESTELFNLYQAKLLEEETINERLCYKIELIANTQEVAYAKRISWIDKENFVPVKEELYAISGKLIKVWTMSEVKDFNGRKFPTKMIVKDKLLTNSKTEIEFIELQFHISLEEEIFNKRWLER